MSGPWLEKSPPKWFSCFQQLGCRKMCCFSKLNCKWPWNLAEEWHLCHECFFCYPVTIQANLAKLKKHICSVDTYQKFTTVTSKKSHWACFHLVLFLLLSRWWDALLKYIKKCFMQVRAARLKLITPAVICFEQRLARNSNGSKGIYLSPALSLSLYSSPSTMQLRKPSSRGTWHLSSQSAALVIGVWGRFPWIRSKRERSWGKGASELN